MMCCGVFACWSIQNEVGYFSMKEGDENVAKACELSGIETFRSVAERPSVMRRQ